jgi:cytochrome P450
MGLPHEDERFFSHCATTAIIHMQDPDASAKAVADMEQYLDDFLAAKEENPVDTDDIISRLVIDRIIPGQMRRDVAVPLLSNVVLNGQDSTGSMIALGCLGLLAYPDQKEKLLNRPELLDSAIDEMLRFFTIAIAAGPRTAIEEVVIGGQTIRKGNPRQRMRECADG